MDLEKYLPQKEGGTEVTIPEIKVLTCQGCKYFRHRLIQSGMNPTYGNFCNHADAPDKLSMYGNIPDMKVHFYIKTPEWCPYLKEHDGKL